MSFCWLWTNFKSFSSVSIVDFEQVHVCWEGLMVLFLLVNCQWKDTAPFLDLTNIIMVVVSWFAVMNKSLSSWHTGCEKFPTETFSVKVNLRKQKYLISCTCKPLKTKIKELTALVKIIDLHTEMYEEFNFLSDFNVSIPNEEMKGFCNFHVLTSLNDKKLI